MTERFKNAVDALVYAFFNDTLAKGSCAACAVGNIVAHGFKKKLNPQRLDRPVCNDEGFTNNSWTLAFSTSSWFGQSVNTHNFNNRSVLACVSSTSYSIDDLIKVEYAFETSTNIEFISYTAHTKSEIMQDQYNGLMAVLDVLCEIEGVEDPTEYKELFTIS